MNPTITAVAGLEAGHYTDRAHGTGCTVFLCRQGAVGGVDVRGGSPGTRETDLLSWKFVRSTADFLESRLKSISK